MVEVICMNLFQRLIEETKMQMRKVEQDSVERDEEASAC
jgi:hypothetical protein